MVVKPKERTRQFAVLLVEDNPADVELTREALGAEGRGPGLLHAVRSAEEALEALGDRELWSSSTLPDLILLDLKLPGMSGGELLEQLKSDARWSSIPVVILSSSAASLDVEHAYRHHANAYVEKGHDLTDLRDRIRSVDCFWFETATLSSGASRGGAGHADQS